MSPDYLPRQRVKVTAGIARGRLGEVVRRADWNWADRVPLYVVDLDGDALVSTIRADFLEMAN